MRKIIAITALFALFGATMLPLSEASRYVYHLYTQNSSKYKRSSGRISPYNYGRRIKRINFHGPTSYWATHKAEEYKTDPQKYYYPPSPRPVIRTARLIASSWNKVFPSYKFLAEIPHNFKKDNSGVYKDDDSSLSFRILQTPEKYKCYQKNFKLCAIDLGKGFKREQSLGQTQTYFSSYRSHQTNLHSFVKYPVFVESFKGTLFGSENVYFVFNTLNPFDGSVIRIEAVVNEKEKTKAAQTMFKIFESFRIKS